MRIHMLTSIGGEPSYSYGDVVDVRDDIARAWIAEGMAEPFTGRQESVETTTAEPRSERAVSRPRQPRKKAAKKKAAKKKAD